MTQNQNKKAILKTLKQCINQSSGEQQTILVQIRSTTMRLVTRKIKNIKPIQQDEIEIKQIFKIKQSFDKTNTRHTISDVRSNNLKNQSQNHAWWH